MSRTPSMNKWVPLQDGSCSVSYPALKPNHGVSSCIRALILLPPFSTGSSRQPQAPSNPLPSTVAEIWHLYCGRSLWQGYFLHLSSKKGTPVMEQVTCKDLQDLHPSEVSSPNLECHHSLHGSHLLHPRNKEVHAMAKPSSMPWHLLLPGMWYCISGFLSMRGRRLPIGGISIHNDFSLQLD